MKKIIALLFVSLITLTTVAQKKRIKKQKSKTTVTQIKTTQKPTCVQQLIEKFSKEKVQNPPISIYSYSYKGKTVYYVTPPCCDFFSDVYDENCILIGHPDGGITGKGDMKMTDFNTLKKDEKLVWQDARK